MVAPFRASAVLIAASVVAAAGLADTEPVAIDGWGRVTDPDRDCKLTAEKGKLTVTVPGTNHNLNPAVGMNAPRVLREVEGDFTATVKVTGEFDPGETASLPGGGPFNGAGLLVWADDRNYLRVERDIWWVPEIKKHACYPPLVEYYKDGEYQDTDPPGTTDEFFKGKSTYLRVERKGKMVTASYSHDGKKWTAAKEVAVDLPRKVRVGVAAVSTSAKPFAVEFEGFEVAAGKKGD